MVFRQHSADFLLSFSALSFCAWHALGKLCVSELSAFAVKSQAVSEHAQLFVPRLRGGPFLKNFGLDLLESLVLILALLGSWLWVAVAVAVVEKSF